MGVFFDRKKKLWHSIIRIDNKIETLGWFNSESRALEAYSLALKQHKKDQRLLKLRKKYKCVIKTNCKTMKIELVYSELYSELIYSYACDIVIDQLRTPGVYIYAIDDMILTTEQREYIMQHRMFDFILDRIGTKAYLIGGRQKHKEKR